MAKHGHLGEFDNSKEDWKSYIERMQQYYTANDIADPNKQRALLLSSCGASTYRQIKNVLAPKLPTEVEFNNIVTQMTTHFQPATSETVQRYLFNSRIRRPHETIAIYVAELKKISEHCNFGDTLEQMLRDRLVCGIADERWQRRLLSEEDLTFKNALKISQALEAAERQVKDLLGPAQVHQVRRTMDRRPARSSSEVPCYRCGGPHPSPTCRFKDAECRYCHKIGHLAKVCRTKKAFHKQDKHRTSSRGTHQITEGEDNECATEYTMYNCHANGTTPLLVKVTVNDIELQMEVDTGATLSVISEHTYRKLWSDTDAPPLQHSTAKLKTYTGEKISVKGSIEVDVTYQEQKARLSLIVVQGDGPSLLGRDWLQWLQLDWSHLHQVSSSSNAIKPRLQGILDEHPEVFEDELGQIRGTTAKIFVDEETTPKFWRARPVPYALREKVEKELDRLVETGVIEPVQFSDWAAPIVPVIKKDGSVRICGDYKVTVNQVSKNDTYPLPRIEDIFASLSGGTSFSKLDLAHAYQQITLDEESRKYVTVNTHKGLYRYNRLPFGVTSAPSIFQRTMENILQGLPHVSVYIDDILITGKTDEEHLQNLDGVLKRFEEAGVRLRRDKCRFMLPSVEYLGHKISEKGLQPTDNKVLAIKEAPTPKDVSQLKSFLGLVNYYGKFLNNLSSTLSPLYRLLQAKTKWSWGSEQEESFRKVKSMLTSDCLLIHYDPDKELLLACDASPYGVGAVLSHKLEDGQEKPIAFASRSLAPAERKYSQLEKEGLAVVFGVKRFHQYIFGRHFTIHSDHKPLQHLFKESSTIPTMASARIQRWSLTLGAYDYSITYKEGKYHANADSLSRLPLPKAPVNIPVPEETILLMDALKFSPVNANQIKLWTDRDPLLAKVRHLVLHGWQEMDDPMMQPYQQRQNELSTHDGCILWGNRVIIPTAGRQRVIDELHEGHPGVSRMKSLARGFVWWPRIDKDLEEKVKQCSTCQEHRHHPPPAPLHPWEWPKHPWVRLHADYVGPFMGKMFLVVIDAYSKWIEVKTVSSATSTVTTNQLRSIFATHGLPEILVTDNGTTFTSAEFQEFAKNNGIRHVKTAPYHPSSNGLAERAVQTLKSSLKKHSNVDLETQVARFLFRYRITPHSTTGVAPAELLLGRLPRSHLDLLKPSLASKVHTKQANQKTGHDSNAKQRCIAVGDAVFVCDFPSGKKWLSGKVIDMKGPMTYLVELQDGRIVRRHIDHVRNRTCTSLPTSTPIDEYVDVSMSSPSSEQPVSNSPITDIQRSVAPPLRRSTRNSRPPDRYVC